MLVGSSKQLIDGTIQTIERTIKVEKLASISCYFYTYFFISCRYIWYINSSIKSCIIPTWVYVDETDLGTIPYGVSRPDVNSVYPGYSSGNNAGFDETINISSISAGNKIASRLI